MKNFWRIAEKLGLLCVIGATSLAALNFLAILAMSFGLDRPVRYFQDLNLPLLSVALPVLGIMMLLPLALREAFTHKSAPEKGRAAKTMNWRQTVNKWRNRFHLRPV